LARETRYQTSCGELHETCAIDGCPFYHRRDDLKNSAVPAPFTRYPIDIELDLPMQHCNIGGEDPKSGTACIMCERSLFYERQEDRVDEICERLKPYAKHFRFLHVQGVAESFWKDRIFDVVEKIGVDVNTCRITTYTNGTILGGARLDRWLRYPWTCTTFSIDAATPETFKKIRIWDAYDRIIANMMEFSRRRSPYQNLQIHNTINLINIDEVVGMVEVAAKVKADLITFNPTHNLHGMIVSQENVHLFDKAQKQIKKAAAKLNVNLDFTRDFRLDFKVEPDLVQISV
jgi:MoaA/NifB/PqqE/SkfB family radical SAM enzyme